MQKTVWVMGATGKLGEPVARHLNEDGFRETGLVSLASSPLLSICSLLTILEEWFPHHIVLRKPR